MSLLLTSNPDDNFDIYEYSLETGAMTRLTDHTADDLTGHWSPDETSIVYESRRDGRFELYRQSLETGEVVRLTDDPEDDFYSAWGVVEDDSGID
jgi:TolB protein